MSVVNQFISLIAIVAFGTVAYLSLQKVDVAFSYVEKYLEIEAYHDCAQDYRMEYTNLEDNTVISQPLAEPYEQCLEDKGLR